MTRVRLLAVGMLGALALAAGCGGDGGGGAASASAGADLIRANAIVFASISSDLDSAQWQQLDDLLRKFPGREQALQMLRAELEQEGLNYERDVKDALGPTIDLAVGAAAAGGDTPSFVVMTQPDDLAKARALVEKLNASSEGDDDDAVTREVDGWLVIADDEASIDGLLAGDGASLGDAARFDEALEELPDEALASVFLDGPGLVQFVQGFAEQAGQSLPLAGLEELQYAVAWIAAEDAGVGLAAVAKGGELLTGAAEPYASELSELVPAGALAFLSFPGKAVGTQLDQALQSGLPAQAVEEFEQQTGISLEQLIDLFQGETALYVRPGAPIPEIGVILEAEDAQAQLATLRDLLGKLAAAAGGEVTTSQEGGVEVSSANFGQFAVHVGAVEGKVVLTTNRAAFADFASPSGDRLPDDPVFQEAKEAAGMPDETTGFLYVNLKDALPLIETFAQTAGEALPPEVSPNLRPLRSVVLYGTRDGDLARSTLFVEIR